MTCCFKRCRRLSDLNYMGKDICDYHWEKLCNSNDENKLLKEIGLERVDGKVVKLKKKSSVSE